MHSTLKTHGCTREVFGGFGKLLRSIPLSIVTLNRVRIPETMAEPHFSTSKWLEFPDPFMSVIRNPVVGDQWNRYYFFPSDQYASTGANPDWPTTKPPPQYRTYDPVTHALGPLLKLGIPTPIDPPIVVPAPTSVTKTATADAPSGSTSLTLNNTTDLSDGMEVTDASLSTVTYTTTAATAPNSVSLSYPALTSTSLTPTTISKNLTIGAAAGSAFMTVPSTAGLTVRYGGYKSFGTIFYPCWRYN